MEFDLESHVPPRQVPISREAIEEMIRLTPRRRRLCDLDQPLKRPGQFGDDWNLSFPFQETFVPAFNAACAVDHIPFRSKSGTFTYTYLKDASEEQIQQIERWLSVVSHRIAIRDRLAVSFALDYDREDGDPKKRQTEIARLRTEAKRYDGGRASAANIEAAKLLACKCVEFLHEVRSYNVADCVVGAPPSRVDKPYDLPRTLAALIGESWGREDLTTHVRTVRNRPQLKEQKVESKLSSIEGTIAIDRDVFQGRNVLIVDDLYQSGVSINYVGMLLLEAGARRVLGLACEKTCRNDDNVGGRSEA